jgi:hypothetical protein
VDRGYVNCRARAAIADAMSPRQRRIVLALATLSAASWIAELVSMAVFVDGAERVDTGVNVQALYLAVLATLCTLVTVGLGARWLRGPSNRSGDERTG